MVSYIRTYPQEYYYNNPITCPSSELSLPPSTSIFMKQSQVVPTAGPTPEINSPGASPADGSLEHFEALIGTTLGGPVKMSVNVPCNENCKLVNRRGGNLWSHDHKGSTNVSAGAVVLGSPRSSVFSGVLFTNDIVLSIS